MIRHKAAIRTLLIHNGEVFYVEALADGLLDPVLSHSDRKVLAKKVDSELKRLDRSLIDLDEYSEGRLKENIAYLLQRVSNLKLFTQALAA